MSISPGSRLGQYEVQSALGAGGMGEVYLARDTKLGRNVALKILPDSFVHDPDRVARFKREAQLLAALNHPHIAAIYGIEESSGTQFLVLELVEGGTLADKLTRGPVPVAESLAIARQMIDALEVAHEKGIIHRDLKPANIAFTRDDQVKILDFGLAKALDTSSAAELSMSPTLTLAATRAGVILGTAAYMSPEQAKGRATDKRTDVWAFGCVLFEMLTARRAFEGEDVTDTIAAVVRGEPEWSALPPDVPEQIRLLIRRCLDKDRRTRISDIAVARFLITETMPTPAAPATALPPSHTSRRRTGVAATIGVAAGVVLAALAAWAIVRSTPDRPLEPVRFSIVPGAAQPLVLSGGSGDLAISPDGTNIVYRTITGGRQGLLAVRALNDLTIRVLPTTVNARDPFLSPDGHWVGFFADELRKVSITGGQPVSLCRITGAPRGATWAPDNTIIFATTDPTTGLLSVPGGGGEPKVLTKPDRAQGEIDHLFPSVLPDGHAVLFTAMLLGNNTSENARIAVLDLKTGDIKTLIQGGTQAEYVESGHLVYRSGGSLRAVRFNASRLEVLGDPVPVVEQVQGSAGGAAVFVVSRNGTLVYVPAGASAEMVTPRSLVWVTRQGREEPVNAPPRAYAIARISPDATRVALDIRDRGNDIWIWDLARLTLTPLSLDARGSDSSPVWTQPDGKRVLWASTGAAGTPNLVWQPADGTGTVERLTESAIAQFPTSISRDGTRVFLFVTGAAGLQDVQAVMLDERAPAANARKPAEQLIHTSAAELDPEISPDGRWLAYQSNKSGQQEIYVCPFPNIDGGLWQVSPSGGTRPAWSRDQTELFYLDAGNFLTAVRVRTAGNAFSASNPTKILSTVYYPGATPRGLDLRSYDVSPDGQRFLMIKDAAASGSVSNQSATMTVVLNWIEELKSLLPSK